jgi:hypothetical protein
MAIDGRRLDLKPAALTETVEDLVGQVRRGFVRVPRFQRALKWAADDVVQLFDSIYRGYPIGSLLFRKAHADAAQLKIGPLTIDAPESHEALWVVDGQQRLTALTAGLVRPVSDRMSDTDVWAVFFDPIDQAFRTPPRDGHVPDSWVPVSKLFDASDLSEWVHNWNLRPDSALRSVVFQAGARVRQYEIPMYVVETGDEELLKQIFFRINKFGKSLAWEDVHDALFGGSGDHPSTLAELAAELSELGMGRPDEDQLLGCLIAFRGLDVTRSFAEHYRRSQPVLTAAVPEALPAIRRVLSFLKVHSAIPHLRLLPRVVPLVVLTRFFAVFPEPSPRTLELLTRWTWRGLLNAQFYDEQTVLRRGVSAIADDDEEASVQRLLTTIPSEQKSQYVLPERFDARAADSRIALLGMASLAPLDIEGGRPVDIPDLIEKFDVNAFRRILPAKRHLGSTPANRLLLPGHGAARRQLIERAALDGVDSVTLGSHAIDSDAAKFLLDGRDEDFIARRKTALELAVRDLGARLAAWAHSDRPSIGYILRHTDDSQ